MHYLATRTGLLDFQIMQVRPSQVQDGDTFVVVDRWGHKEDSWDDGYGPLWVYRETLGVVGVVRAKTWDDAYSCAEDELMDDADPDDPDTYAASYDRDADPEDLAEGVSYRSSGVPSNPRLTSYLYQYDLNGNVLDRLTNELAERLELTIYVYRELED